MQQAVYLATSGSGCVSERRGSIVGRDPRTAHLVSRFAVERGTRGEAPPRRRRCAAARRRPADHDVACANAGTQKTVSPTPATGYSTTGLLTALLSIAQLADRSFTPRPPSPGCKSACMNPTQKAMVPARLTSASPTCAGRIPASAIPAASLTCGRGRRATQAA